jgi:hypothetical protein
MNIIFGTENLPNIGDKYTVLELDTLRFLPIGKEIPTYCVVENIPILEMNKLPSMLDLHKNFLLEYRKKNWNYCEQALEHLMGFWNGELDSFYSEMQKRIDQYKQQDPGENWDGIIEKTLSSV